MVQAPPRRGGGPPPPPKRFFNLPIQLWSGGCVWGTTRPRSALGGGGQVSGLGGVYVCDGEWMGMPVGGWVVTERKGGARKG